MQNKTKLTNEQIKESAYRIAKPSFNFMKKLIIRELDRLKCEFKTSEINANNVVDIISIALSQVDANILIMIRNLYKGTMGEDIDFVKMMSLYFKDIMSIMNEDEQKRLREKLN